MTTGASLGTRRIVDAHPRRARPGPRAAGPAVRPVRRPRGRAGRGRGAAVARRRGLEVYRALNRLAAIALPHFDAEETELMPRLWALLSDDEIAEVRAAIMASIDPDEAAYTVDSAGE